MRTNTKHILVLFTCLSSSTLSVGCGDDGEDPSNTGNGTTGGQTESGPTTDDSGPTTDGPTTTATTTTATTGANTTGEPTTGATDTGNVETGSTGGEPLAIIGSYVEQFPEGMGYHEITETSWVQDFGKDFIITLDILQYDNEAHWVVTQDADFPDNFSKLQWTYVADDLYYCSVVFDAMSEQEALDAPLADDSDPANGGCGDFPWSLLMPN